MPLFLRILPSMISPQIAGIREFQDYLKKFSIDSEIESKEVDEYGTSPQGNSQIRNYHHAVNLPWSNLLLPSCPH